MSRSRTVETGSHKFVKKKRSQREFIRRAGTALVSGALGLGGFEQEALAGRPTDGKDYGFYGSRKDRWRNWTHNIDIKPLTVVRPKTLDELKRAVGSAERIRAVGSAHSITGLAPSEDTIIDTTYLESIIGFDLDDELSTVTVLGGMKLQNFSNELASHGYALPSTG